MSDARNEILGRIRAALPRAADDIAASHAAIRRNYIRRGTLEPEACLELFVDRLLDYDTEIIQINSEDSLPGAIAEALQRAREKHVVVPQAFPTAWLPDGIEVVPDGDLTTTEIDRAEVVLTTCEIAIASTGTILLVHDGAQGHRALTLLPDHHVCLVRRNQVVETVPEAFSAIATLSRRPITTISGPSATSDIEMTRVRGVHGPRRLTVILYGNPV